MGCRTARSAARTAGLVQHVLAADVVELRREPGLVRRQRVQLVLQQPEDRGDDGGEGRPRGVEDPRLRTPERASAQRSHVVSVFATL